MPRFRKVERKVLKPLRQEVVELRKLEKRLLGSHLLWTAKALYPGRTPLAALLLMAADRLKHV